MPACANFYWLSGRDGSSVGGPWGGGLKGEGGGVGPCLSIEDVRSGGGSRVSRWFTKVMITRQRTTSSSCCRSPVTVWLSAGCCFGYLDCCCCCCFYDYLGGGPGSWHRPGCPTFTPRKLADLADGGGGGGGGEGFMLSQADGSTLPPRPTPHASRHACTPGTCLLAWTPPPVNPMLLRNHALSPLL